MNEALLHALLRARLREDDIAAHLGVDPKTVRRWLKGRVPYPQNRAAIADLVGVDEADLWPGAGGPLTAVIRTEPRKALVGLTVAVPHVFVTASRLSSAHGRHPGPGNAGLAGSGRASGGEDAPAQCSARPWGLD